MNIIALMTWGAALGSALIAGVFFAFSTFVMAALARLPPAQGIAAMQAINVTVLNPWFLGVFVGTAIACVVLAVTSLMHWGRAGPRGVSRGEPALPGGFVRSDARVQHPAQRRA